MIKVLCALSPILGGVILFLSSPKYFGPSILGIATLVALALLWPKGK